MMRVVIVGAGIGGSALALALHKVGIDYVLVEQTPELTTVGAGIQLSPNGVRILEWLGLEEDLERFCVEPNAHLFKEWDTGKNVLTTPLSPKVRRSGYERNSPRELLRGIRIMRIPPLV